MNKEEAIAAIANSYSSIGYLYYKAHKDDPEPAMRPHVSAINAAIEIIANAGQADEEEAPEQPLGTTQTCPNCGSAISENDRFCGECGTPVSEQPDLEPATPSPTAPESSAAPSGAARDAQPRIESENCPYCGSMATPDQGVCLVCGSPLK